MMPLLTPHFSLQELTVTQQTGPDGRRLPNNPGDLETLYLRVLAETLLEPIRVLWECPVRVTSGYRGEAVERAVQERSGMIEVGAAIRKSQHLRGQAADIGPLGTLDLDEAYRRIWASALPYDQLILEEKHYEDRISRWIHVSCAPVFYPPRRRAFTSTIDKHGHVTDVTYAGPTPTEGIA